MLGDSIIGTQGACIQKAIGLLSMLLFFGRLCVCVGGLERVAWMLVIDRRALERSR